MTFFRTVTRLAGISLCVVAFAGTAAAGNNGGGNGTEKGNSAAAHEQKADRTEATATSESQSQQSAEAQAKADVTVAAKGSTKAEAKAAAKASVTPTAKATVSAAVTAGGTNEVESQAKGRQKAAQQTKKAARAQAKAAVKPGVATTVAAKVAAKQAAKAQVQPQSSGRSAEAHHHVIVCHRTGSNSNPYVVINIPTTAWSEAHSNVTGSHPPKNGRHDILLKDPASRPGSKDGFTKQSSCPAPAAVRVQQSDVCPNIEGMQTTVPLGTVKQGNGACVATKADVTVQPTVVAQVAAAQTPVQTKAAVKAQVEAQAKAQKPAKPPKPTSGVLGAVASAPEAIGETATSGTLPFTGIPLWVAVLLGSAFLLTGLALRRATQH